MIQAAAVVQEQMVTPVKVAIHTQEEEQQDPMAQEEEHPLHQEDSQEAVHLQGTLHRSRQEEQDLQAALHIHLQGYLNPADIQIHGLHWTDLGKLYATDSRAMVR